MLGKRSFNRTLNVAIITKDTYPLRAWTLVCGVGYSLRTLLINISDTMSEEARQETVRILCTFFGQLPKAIVPRRLALEYSKGPCLSLCNEPI